MSKALHQFILISLVFILDVGFSNPVLKKRESDPPDNPFDAGLIDSCKVPTAEQLPICSKYIGYPVPEALLSAAVAGIREKDVYGAKKTAERVEESTGEANKITGCGITVEELECYQKFPQCVNSNTEVAFTNESCLTKLKDSCTGYDFLKPSCGIQENVSLATCSLVSSSSHKYQYNYCSNLQGWSEVYLTEWMSVSVISGEKDIESFIVQNSNPQCVTLYTELRCGEAGRCWHQGTRMEINSTRELCESVLNCVSTSLRSILEQQLSCSSYPSKADKLATPATEITQPTVQTEASSNNTPETSITSRPDITVDTDKPNIGLPSVTFPPPNVQGHSPAPSAVFTSVLKMVLVSIILVLALLL